MKLYDRIQFADDTKGLILSIKSEGERTMVIVLTDGYEQVSCDPDQVGILDRRDVPMLTLESHKTGGWTYKLFTSEINMLARYSMAVWHDYWAKHHVIGFIGRLPLGAAQRPAYWDFYQAGNIEPLPVEKDIRRSEVIKPKQESMDIGGNRGD